MARKREEAKGEASGEQESVPVAASETCPTFTLRADQPGHLRALIAALEELPEGGAYLPVIRDFELWEEAHRCR